MKGTAANREAWVGDVETEWAEPILEVAKEMVSERLEGKLEEALPELPLEFCGLCYNGECVRSILHACLFPGSAGSAGSAIAGTWGRDFIILK